MSEALEITGLRKSYGPVEVLRGVDLHARAGEIHALLGENGAGKSTLIKVLSGVTGADAGTVTLGGRRLTLGRPTASTAAGVRTVFQELSTIPQLTVAENLLYGAEPLTPWGLVSGRRLRAQAREVGIANITLRDIAKAVGMQPPSLYTHFDSKNAVYDAMYAGAWAEYEAYATARVARLPEHPREALHLLGRVFFDFAVADLARHQLMNQRTIPGFEPTAESYAPAVRVLEGGVALLASVGVTDRADFDIWISLLGGLIDQQLANDPGGDRFGRLLGRAIDMFADAVGLSPLPAKHPTRRKAGSTR